MDQSNQETIFLRYQSAIWNNVCLVHTKNTYNVIVSLILTCQSEVQLDLQEMHDKW